MKFNKKNINELAMFLNNGIYTINFDNTQLKKIGTKEISHFNNYNNKSIKLFIKKILSIFNIFYIRSSTKVFNGNIVLFPSKQYGFKIFNNNNILTYYYDSNMLNEQLINRDKINIYFNTPKIIEINEHYVIEERIIGKICNTNEAVDYLLDSYLLNLAFSKETKKMQKNRFYNEYKKIYELLETENDNYLIAPQHCDFWGGNILKSNDGEIFILDYENYSLNYFLYDFFFLLFTNCQLYNDYCLLDNYLSSYYDSKLKKLFIKMNIIYNSNNKIEYFKIFLNIYIQEKFKKYDHDVFDYQIKQLKDIFLYAKEKNEKLI